MQMTSLLAITLYALGALAITTPAPRTSLLLPLVSLPDIPSHKGANAHEGYKITNPHYDSELNMNLEAGKYTVENRAIVSADDGYEITNPHYDSKLNVRLPSHAVDKGDHEKVHHEKIHHDKGHDETGNHEATLHGYLIWCLENMEECKSKTMSGIGEF